MGSLGSKEYRFAQALLVFSSAWEELAKASIDCPDQDVSDLYPFYLLDYEEIAPAVKSWCLHHASRIMKQVPDQVYNPECFQCPYLGSGIDKATGLCEGYPAMKCGRHPYIQFSPEAVRPFLLKHEFGLEDTDLSKVSPEGLQLMYMRRMEQG